jgi:rod shape determining protein RodA
MMLLTAGVKARWLVAMVVGGVAAGAGAIIGGLLEDYQLERLTAFLDPGNVALAKTSLYNSNQSAIAIGSGGLTGKGFLNGSQTNLAYVPENHTDFIFTVLGEQFGFLGAACLVILLLGIVLALVRVAMSSSNRYGQVIAGTTAGMWLLQIGINVGMTIGLAPVSGVPLPFVSYGGTSLLTSWMLIGLAMGAYRFRDDDEPVRISPYARM